MQTADHSNMKLGKLSPVHDSRTLSLTNYINADILPVAPTQYAYGNNVGETAWGMMVNDKANNCTCAAAGHLIMEWTADNGVMVTPTDQDIINVYAAITGYDPITGQNNDGAAIMDVLNYWRKTGIASHKILAYAKLEPKNTNHVMQAIYLFGGCYVGLDLPMSAKTQEVWSVPPGGATGIGAPGSWGGHVVPVIGYDNDFLTIITWGITKKMDWSFWNAYCDESYAIISNDFAGKKAAPNGFDLSTLKDDLKQITGKMP
ncbi:MAG: hypothetical protein JWP45_2358 [Mucilaginibacter sp.]|nr:hypothetical protein [Mucilaginibacter sp.]